LLEHPERFVRTVSPRVSGGQRLESAEVHEAVVQEPVTHLDRVDDPALDAVGHERRFDAHVAFLQGRQRLGPVQEDAVEGQVEVAGHHEVDRLARSVVEP